MKKIIKIAAVVFAVSLMLAVGVYAFASNAYTWKTTATIEYNSDGMTFATISDMKYDHGSKTGSTFTSSADLAAGKGLIGYYDDRADSELHTYDPLDYSRPLANGNLGTWDDIGSSSKITFTQTENCLRLTFTITNDGDTAIVVKVSYTKESGDTNNKLVVEKADGTALTAGATPVQTETLKKSGDAGDSATFTFDIVLNAFREDVTLAVFNFKVDIGQVPPAP